MKLLCLSDIHSALDVFQSILDREPAVDVLLLAGDLEDRLKRGTVTELLQRAKAHSQHVLAVSGNNDDATVDQFLQTQGVSLHRRGVCIGNVGFYGASGTPETSMGTKGFTESMLAESLETAYTDVSHASRRILVVHTPPRDSNVDVTGGGKILGSTSVCDHVLRTAPSLVVCGHFHRGRGTGRSGKTPVLNCGMAGRGEYAVVQFDEDAEVQIELKQLT